MADKRDAAMAEADLDHVAIGAGHLHEEVEPPGAKGTSSRIGLPGSLACATAVSCAVRTEFSKTTAKGTRKNTANDSSTA